MSAARLLGSSRVRHGLLCAVGVGSGLHRSGTSHGLSVFESGSIALANPQDAALVKYGRRAQSQIAEAEAKSKKETKRGDAELIDKANDPDVYSPAFADDDHAAWAAFSRNFANVTEGISRIEWAGIGGKIRDYIVPPWARNLDEALRKLQNEFSMAPGSLADEMWQEAHDSSINPEILWYAKVRTGHTLSQDEIDFRARRKEKVVKSLAMYLELNEKDIHPDDVPTIAMCGSGGGLRAMVAGTGSYLSAQEAGLYDLVTYTAGVSGSCWLQTLFFSSIGKQDFHTIIAHLKSRLRVHIAYPPTVLNLVTLAPTNKFILSGLLEKMKGDPKATFGLVDVYSLMLTARLLVPKGDLDVQDTDLKLSNQTAYMENGDYPMPIYTLVRHEIPAEDLDETPAKNNPELREKLEKKAKKEAWFQWIEMHPWEVWCEEFGAGIPTWSLGRPFEGGRNKILDTGIALPEMRQSLLLGIWGSAFCATLSHYYKEIRPLLIGLSGFAGVDELLEGRNRDLVKIHPIEPATIPNFAYGMQGRLADTCPDSIPKSSHLQLMDAGMSNNLPIYPLLRPGRDVDILIAFDASADIQKENWLSVVDGYAKQRGVKGWPIGAGWPQKSSKPEENVAALTEAQEKSPQAAATKIAEMREERRQNDDGEDSDQKDRSPSTSSSEKSSSSSTKSHEKPNQSKSETTTPGSSDSESDLGPCTVWVGLKQERASESEPPPSKRLAWDDPKDSTFHLMQPDAGITLIYFPLLPHKSVPGVDPDKTDFLSTWNFIYKPQQIDDVVRLAKTNFQEGADMTKRTIRAVYERKKKIRQEKEKSERIDLWKKKLRDAGDAFRH